MKWLGSTTENEIVIIDQRVTLLCLQQVNYQPGKSRYAKEVINKNNFGLTYMQTWKIIGLKDLPTILRPIF